MRPGVFVSIIGHIGFVIMTLLAWPALQSTVMPQTGAVVPVEIVDVAAKSNVQALAEDVPDEEVSPDEQEQTEAQPEPTPAPAPPAQRTRPQRNDEFDLSAVAGLLDKQRQPGRQRTEGQTADRSRPGAGLGTAAVVAMEDRARALLRVHMRRCWRMPIDLPDPERLVVVVEFDLNRNGTLNGQPRLVSPPPGAARFDPPMQAAVDAAMRAVRQCDPYPLADDPQLGEHYEIWRTQSYRFAPAVN